MNREASVTALRELNEHLKYSEGTPGYPIIDWAADEIDRLRSLVRELRPYMEVDLRNGVSLEVPRDDHEFDACEDCLWYMESLSWKRRVEVGELDV